MMSNQPNLLLDADTKLTACQVLPILRRTRVWLSEKCGHQHLPLELWGLTSVVQKEHVFVMKTFEMAYGASNLKLSQQKTLTVTVFQKCEIQNC